MELDLYHTKQAIEVFISQKIVSNNLKQFSFNQSQIKIPGLILDTKLTFTKRFENKIVKCNRIISCIGSISNTTKNGSSDYS